MKATPTKKRYPVEDEIEFAWDLGAEYEAMENRGPGIFETGPKGLLKKKILMLIEGAEQVLCVASFIFHDEDVLGALLDASERGVRVYFLSSPEANLNRIWEDRDEFNQKRIESHKRTLKKMAGRVLIRSGGHLHAKYVLADPHTNPRGYLLTANLTHEALTRNPELGVELTAEELQELFSIFCLGFWDESQRELLGEGDLTKRPDFSMPEGEFGSLVVATTSKNTGLRETVLDLIARAQERIQVSTYSLDRDHAVIDALCMRAAELPVEVIVRTLARNTEGVQKLVEAGAQVAAHPYVHAKGLCIDDSEAVIMTANLEPRGMDEGYEVGVKLSDDRATQFSTVLSSWMETFPARPRINTPIIEMIGPIMVPAGKDWKRETVVEQFRDKRRLKLNDVREMKGYELPAIDTKGIFAHEVEITFEFEPPRLPNGAKRSKDKHSLPVYEEGKQKFVVIKDKSEVTKATQLADEIGARVVVNG